MEAKPNPWREQAEKAWLEGWSAGWIPDPELTVSEWAEAHRVLASVSSSEPGKYRLDRTPYCKEPMDCLSTSSPIRTVVFMGGSQIGKTEIGNNWLASIIDHSPASTLMVYPTVEVARRISKQRLDPMIDAMPLLRQKIRNARVKDSGNTTFMKDFPGGVLILTGANSGSGLRSMPIKNAFCDELDAWLAEIPNEGDPLKLVTTRQETFARAKTYLCSTPTVKGVSRIENAFLQTDQRRYFLPCPHCGAFDWIRWENLRMENKDPATTRLLCVFCGVLTEERYKTWMMAHGEWRPTAVSTDPRVRGYHLSAFYSPLGWKSWERCAAEFLQSKDDRSQFKVWWNLTNAETWEERGEGADPDALAKRRHVYFPEGSPEDLEVPHGVGVLVASVDVQGGRLEAIVRGFGAAEQSWLIAWSQFDGDPAQETVWFDLDQFLSRKWKHESGRLMPIEVTAVDSGGHHTEQVYKFCKARFGRRVFAIKGGGDTGKPLVGRPSLNNSYRCPLFILCVNTGKEEIYSRLAMTNPGPSYMHFPEWIDEEYLAQLTAEKGIWKYRPGRGSKRTWVKTRERNEALDLEVYALAALHIKGRPFILTLPELAAIWSKPPDPEPPLDANPEGSWPAMPRSPRGGNWVTSWGGR